VSFGVSRINMGGRHQTLTMKTNVGRLQQRGLISYDIPKLLNRDDLRFTATTLYDNTVDVSTFTSKRLEGTLQVTQALKRDATTGRELTTLSYRFSYRRVQATSVQVTDNLIPLLSKPTRVGIPNFLYVRNRRDSDLESTRGNYTTVEGGVASSYFGSEADFSRLLLKNSTYHTFFRNRSTRQGFVFARSTSVGIENPFGNTVLLDPSETATAGQTLVPLPERFFSGGGRIGSFQCAAGYFGERATSVGRAWPVAERHAAQPSSGPRHHRRATGDHIDVAHRCGPIRAQSATRSRHGPGLSYRAHHNR